MKVKVQGLTTTKICGSAPALGYREVLSNYVEKKIDKDLLSFAQQNAKKNANIEDELIKILSLFHRDGKGFPMIGNWMMRKCILNTANAVFNSKKDKDHPAKVRIPYAVQEVATTAINFYNGKVVKKPHGVDTYAMTTRDNSTGKTKSFFKAYEFINPGMTFDFEVEFDDEIVNKKCVDFLLSKIGRTGVGAYRERFGHFEVVV